MFKLAARDYPLSYDAMPRRSARDEEERGERLDRIAAMLAELPDEDIPALGDRLRVRMGHDRSIRARDEIERGRREEERREFSPAITPLTAEETRHAMDAARREVLAAGVPAGLAMDHASSPEGVYAAGVRALGGSCAGHPSSTWPQMFRNMVARGGRGFFDRFPGARNVRVADYNDVGGR